MNPVQRRTAVLCLALAVFAATAAVIHVHAPDGESAPKATHCLICVAGHSPTVLVTAFAPAPMATRIPRVVSLPETGPHSRFLSPDLFIRPPPATV